jgi:molybdenum cofactor biosynthesis enzyme MoaA
MPGTELDWPIVRDLLDDAQRAGVRGVRLYGGEPLLHPDLGKMILRVAEVDVHAGRMRLSRSAISGPRSHVTERRRVVRPGASVFSTG